MLCGLDPTLLFYFTFSGDAGGGVGGGGCFPARSGLLPLGCCFGSNRGGERVKVRSVCDVTHLVLGLKDETFCYVSDTDFDVSPS